MKSSYSGCLILGIVEKNTEENLIFLFFRVEVFFFIAGKVIMRKVRFCIVLISFFWVLFFGEKNDVRCLVNFYFLKIMSCVKVFGFSFGFDWDFFLFTFSGGLIKIYVRACVYSVMYV